MQKRRVYAPKDVIDTYKSYNENQEKYINKILKELSIKTTKDIIKEMIFEKLERNVDRNKLGLKMNINTNVENKADDLDYSRMRELINNWWGANTIIGKILKFVYDQGEVDELTLKTFIKNAGSDNQEGLYKHLISNGKEYKLVFTRDKNQITKINKEVIKYINEYM